MAVRSRYWLAAVLGLWVAHPLAAGEPARLGMAPGPLATPQANNPNQQIADTIADHLRQSETLRHYRVDIAFQDGRAELTGAVANQMQREEVLRIVQGVPGVDRVRDRMTVSGEPSCVSSRVGPVARAQAIDQVAQEEGAGQDKKSPPNGNNGMVEPFPIFRGPAVPHDLNPPKMPPYAWPTYAPYNNASRVAYPTLYPYKAWPFVGPVYPFPKVPLGWRKVKLEWMDGYWWYSPTANSHDWWRLRYW